MQSAGPRVSAVLPPQWQGVCTTVTLWPLYNIIPWRPWSPSPRLYSAKGSLCAYSGLYYLYSRWTCEIYLHPELHPIICPIPYVTITRTRPNTFFTMQQHNNTLHQNDRRSLNCGHRYDTSQIPALLGLKISQQQHTKSVSHYFLTIHTYACTYRYVHEHGTASCLIFSIHLLQKKTHDAGFLQAGCHPYFPINSVKHGRNSKHLTLTGLILS